MPPYSNLASTDASLLSMALQPLQPGQATCLPNTVFTQQLLGPESGRFATLGDGVAVEPSKVHGLGLIAKEPIPAFTIVTFYAGKQAHANGNQFSLYSPAFAAVSLYAGSMAHS
eukprot:4148663-Pleurochrysis_carterae.AAC.1